VRAHIDLRAGTSGFELFRVLALCTLASRVIGTNMQCELSVALQFKVSHHFIERSASGSAKRLEDPGAFGATKTPKSLLFNPYQRPIHGTLYRCAPALSDRMPSTRLPSKDSAFSFRRGVLPNCRGKPVIPYGRGGRCVRGRILQAPSRMVCRASYIR
jgi:hypothetical protein